MSETTTVFIGHLFGPIPSLCQGMAVSLDDIAPYSFLIPFTTNGKNAHFTFLQPFQKLVAAITPGSLQQLKPSQKIFCMGRRLSTCFELYDKPLLLGNLTLPKGDLLFSLCQTFLDCGVVHERSPP